MIDKINDVEALLPVSEEEDKKDEKVELAREFAQKIARTHHATSNLSDKEVKNLLFLLLLDDLLPRDDDDDLSLSKLVFLYEQLALSKEAKGLDSMIRIFAGAINSLDENIPSEMTPLEFLMSKLRG